MAKTSKADDLSSPHEAVRALAAKGDGLLIRFGNVWSFPGAPMDPSGTNLRLPLEYVTDADLQAAMGDSVLVTSTMDHAGRVLAVRLKADEGDTGYLTTSQAGSAEAGTELPQGSRPSVDAGATEVSPNDAYEQTKALLSPKPAQ